MDSYGVIFSCEKRNKFLNFVDMVQIGFCHERLNKYFSGQHGQES